jgi:hypothetical protein
MDVSTLVMPLSLSKVFLTASWWDNKLPDNKQPDLLESTKDSGRADIHASGNAPFSSVVLVLTDGPVASQIGGPGGRGHAGSQAGTQVTKRYQSGTSHLEPMDGYHIACPSFNGNAVAQPDGLREVSKSA